MTGTLGIPTGVSGLMSELGVPSVNGQQSSATPRRRCESSTSTTEVGLGAEPYGLTAAGPAPHRPYGRRIPSTSPGDRVREDHQR